MRPPRLQIFRRRVNIVLGALFSAACLRIGAARYENCTGSELTIGDGACDRDNNIAACSYDGGDCCPSTCSAGSERCVDTTRECLDPNASDYRYAAYANCTGSLSSIDDGLCNSENNNKDCGFDGGDCCPSTCDGSTCPEETESCADLNASDFAFVGFEECTGYLPDSANGRCDSRNNKAECGYDGGDCCSCTCTSANYTCGSSSYDCLDPAAATDCAEPSLAACSDDLARRWEVNDATGAAELATAVNCTGGEFEVAWTGEVSLANTISVTGGTILNITGVLSLGAAIVNGNGDVQLFHVVGGSLHITDLQLINGNAIDGGAVFVEGGVVTFTRTSFDSNSASHRGGALFVDHDADVSWSGDTNFDANTANRAGGAIHVRGSRLSWAGVGMTLFSRNNVSRIEGDSTSGYGGAVRVEGQSKMSWTEATRFSDNRVLASSSDAEARCYGGALSVEAGSSVNWSSITTFHQNEACMCGGAIYCNDSSTISWRGDETNFTNNKAGSGGAVCVDGYSNLSWTSTATFDSNSATAHDGGALYASSSSQISWDGDKTVFGSNHAQEDGGGVYVRDHSTLSFSGQTRFTQNTADDGGALAIGPMGGVSCNGETRFADNVADSDGGAVYAWMKTDIDLATIAMNGVTSFTNNSCGSYGGAIMLGGSVSSTFESDQVNFLRNSAGSAGGAIFFSGIGVGPRFVGLTFEGNSAQVGGAVYATGSGTTYSAVSEERHASAYVRCTFTKNKATATGGAVESAAGKDVLVNSTFIGNEAQQGGALRLAGFAAIRGCSFVANRAGQDGGPGVSIVGFTSQMTSCSFSDNVFMCERGEFLDYEEGNRYEKVCEGCSECQGTCQVDDATRAPKCTGALDHTTSEGLDVTLSTLVLEEGYWRATASSRNILQCFNAHACQGGVTGKGRNCANGYEGPYCAVCSDNYAVSLAFRCSECSSKRGVIFASAVLPIAALLLAALVAFLASKEAGRTKDNPSRFQQLRKRVPLDSVKIVIVSWQIMTSISSVGNITFPNVYQRLLDGLELVNFDVGWALSTGGCFNVNFHDRLLTSTLGPLLCACLLWVTYKVARYRNRRSSEALQRVRYKHSTIFLWMTFLVYSSVSSTIFKTFACEELDDGKEYLRADYQIECQSLEHKVLKVYAGFMIAVYPLGIPLFYVAVLFKGRDAWKIAGVRSRHDAHVQAAAVLSRPYRPGCFYYEVVECVRRILLTGAVVFIHPNSAQQLAVALVMACTFSLVSEALAPYSSLWDAWVARAGHIMVLLSVFVAFLMKLELDEDNRDAFGGLLLASNVILILSVVAEGIALSLSLKRSGEGRVSLAVKNAVSGFGSTAVGFGNAADGFFPSSEGRFSSKTSRFSAPSISDGTVVGPPA